MSISKLKQRGDTIVEVMIVLTVLALAISISYATANRSLLNARQAQESSHATAIAQSQIEQLRGNAAIKVVTDPNYIFINPVSTKFCFDSSGTGKVVNPADSRCSFDVGAFAYNVSITHNNSPNNSNGSPFDTFTVTVGWPDVLGQGQDSVILIYRVHPAP